MSNNKGSSPIVSPQSGGAQSGLGETFSPDLFSGTGNFSVPIAVPAGRNGFQPEITLGYSSGNGNGAFGMGWNLSIPGITRKTSKGIPVYNDNTDIFILSGAEDLVPVKKESGSESSPSGLIKWEKVYYRPRTEGLFARIIHHKKNNGEDYWEVRSKDGLISWYGSPKETGDNRAVVANPEGRNQIYAWSLTKTEDPFGNEIIYQYNRELVLNAKGRSYDQLYLKNIQYAQCYRGNQKKHLCEVAFVYEERPDPFSTYRQGFEVRTTKRCIRIESFTHATQTEKVKTYHFDYHKEIPLNGATLLGAVSVEGHKGTESEWMPPLDFNYSNLDLSSPPQLDKIEGLSAAYLTAPGFELIDVTGNGLPDLVQMDVTGSRYWTNKGNGKFSAPRNMQMAPGVYLGTPGVQMIDANGDGRADLLVTNGVQAGYYPGKFRQVWDEKSYRPYQQAPSFSFTDPEVQLIDLDGDGITDVLRNGSKFECFLNDPEKGFYTVRTANKQQIELSFSDPRIRFADMTGDGLQDIVMITSGKVQYWPNLGYGRFGNKIVMRNAPRFPQNYDPKMVLLGDLDGDGQADIAFVENNSVTLYINQSGNAFSDGHKTFNTPVALPDSVRISDMMGTGQSGILWNLVTGNAALGQLRFLDFTRGNKPYVLQAMNNNMGSLTRVEYGSSVYHYLRDEPNPATRWKTDLPFPVQVVNKVEVLDLLSGGKLVTQYNYHHGYWDGFEREFRGFASVDVQDTETFERYNTQDLFSNENTDILTVTAEQYSPPVQTRNWFYPGPVGGANDWIDPDFSDEYWQGDQNVLERPLATKDLLKNLPRRARRDALRTLRGTLLRSEQYALDGSDIQNRPYTITESVMGIRQEFDPAQIASNAWTESQGAYWSGGGYIFFPFSVAQRSSQYERGDDPMHSYSFTQNYDAYGQVQGALSVGLPRKSSPIQGSNGEYLGTYELSEYIYVDTPDQYMVDRVKRSVSYNAVQATMNRSVFAYKDAVFNLITNQPEKVIACSIQYYDGAAFDGLSYGKIGKYGAVVRSESLVITDDIIANAYGTTVPECFKNTPDWSSSNGYPADFANLLQNGDARLGYKDRRVGFSQSHIPGWYAEGGRMQYDFQDGQTTAPFGLVQETRDVFENRSTIEYDTYQILPEKARQWLNATDYLETTAEYDYRTFQVNKITDPNDNISVFDYSPLGLLKATAIIGKGTEGDYKSNTGGFYERYAPSAWMEYDFFAFKNTGNPVWVKTTQREQHWQQDPVSNSPTLIKVEYSDGFGRLLQTRAQAEDVIFGDTTFGSSGLNPVQGQNNAPATGVERAPNSPLNVVVSGWQIYNNKGKVVEQYEPFFDKGFDYQLPGTNGVKIIMYYDPLQRVVRTLNPDKSEQRVFFGVPKNLNNITVQLSELSKIFYFTPWESVAYDANDLASITHGAGSNVPLTDYFTPKSTLIDALGRTIRTTEYWNNADYNDTIVMQYRYDIRGNLLQVKDPYGRTVFEHVYDLRAPQEDETGEKQPLPPLWTKHIDSGTSSVWWDATGKVIRSEDEKGAVGLVAYDTLHRNTHTWTKDKTGENLTLRQYLIYGDSAGLTNPENYNLKGQLYKHYDEAGLVEIPEYDFKGNALKSLRQVIADSEILSVLGGSTVNCYRVDWTGLPNILDVKIFETDSSFDALNRVTQMLYPEDVENERKQLTPVYNRAGALESVRLNGADYVKHIAYNAKGQRLLIAYGNGVMTRYLYHKTTFRLRRQRSETYNQTGWQFDSLGSVKQDTAYTYDLAGNIVKTDDEVTACGVGGTNHLSRQFSYDSLYRLLTATGRENAPDITPIWDDSYRSADNSLTTAYTQNYQYDKLGNILQLRHLGNNPFTRNFNYNNSNNKLQSISIGSTNYTFAYDACGNQTQETASRCFEWDAANQLRCFYVDDGSNITQYTHYLYDAGGKRIKKIVWKQGGNYTSSTYTNDIFEYLTNGTEEQNTLHIMAGQSRFAAIRLGDDFGDTTPAIKYNLEDHLGSSVMQLADDGANINKEEYYPFGETSFGSYAKKRYKYCGKERDEESGLYYYGARYYSSWLCRFISIDPLAKEYSFYTPYQYAGNKPIIAIDIDGLEPGGTVDSIKPLRLYIVSSFNKPKTDNHPYNEPESWFSKGDSRAFFDAAYKVQQEHIEKYGEQKWNHQKRQKTHGAAQIVNYINAQPNDSIGSIDIWTHGSYEGLFSAEVYPAKSYGIKELDKSKIIARANLYTTEELLKNKGGEAAKLASRTLESIDYSKFTQNTIIEIHGCDTAGGSNPSESFTAILSKKLFEAGKTEGVVIGHKGPAGPYYESYKGGGNYGDYRQGERHVYWNGNLIYSTTQKGEITPEQIKNAIDNFKSSIKK